MKNLAIFLQQRWARASLLFLVLMGIPLSPLVAQVMQSSTYSIQSDSINFGGGSSASTNYNLSDSAGENATGDSSSSNYNMHAGFWQMQESYISISAPSDISLASISGLTGGSSEGTAAWLVTTDNTAGYTMTIAASSSPALAAPGVDSFADYVPVAGADPDFSYTNAASDSSFGFSPEGVDVTTRYKDNGVSCNTGSSETSSACWDGFSTTPKTIVTRTSSNQTLGGTTTTVRVHAESGSSHIQTAGTYSATLTVTAVTL